jgi:hypothetical protein
MDTRNARFVITTWERVAVATAVTSAEAIRKCNRFEERTRQPHYIIER